MGAAVHVLHLAGLPGYWSEDGDPFYIKDPDSPSHTVARVDSSLDECLLDAIGMSAEQQDKMINQNDSDEENAKKDFFEFADIIRECLMPRVPDLGKHVEITLPK
jgi:hypothetical protein